MFSRMHSAALLLALTTSLTGGPAGPTLAGEKRADPADPNAAVPPHRYVSELAAYRKPQFEQKLDWRQANDTVREVGGHAGSLNDMPEAAASPSRPAMNHGGHDGHGNHGRHLHRGHGGHQP